MPEAFWEYYTESNKGSKQIYGYLFSCNANDEYADKNILHSPIICIYVIFQSHNSSTFACKFIKCLS